MEDARPDEPVRDPGRGPNRLGAETSPYLRQHADNPVDWYPWGDEALEAAKSRDIPILLSVGYSACHWCHVMAHETFEDDAIAAKMNEAFVNIKVDREERPDIDALYMDAVQGMTGQGGWPMTVVMTPDGRPFFAGTYFPPTPQRGMPGFGDIIDSLADAWQTRRVDVVDTAAHIATALGERAEVVSWESLPDHSALADASRMLVRAHDRVHGGFGAAPKFPSPMALDVLLRHHVRSGDQDALDVTLLTLEQMAAGGLYDQLAGGFARYSVDDHWAVPHFEKMLYDNALLVPAYLHGWQLTGSPDLRQIVVETVEYVLRDLQLPDGGLASAEDADSEGEEGRFYVWSHDELSSLLSADDLHLAMDWYGVTVAGNFEGTNVLHRRDPGNLVRPSAIETLRIELLEYRAQRVRPGLDDKVLVEWNALMISALAEAGAALGRTDWVAAAIEVMEFLEANLLSAHGRWHRSWQIDGGPRHLAYAADYAAVIDAYTRLGEATGHSRWHRSALGSAESMLELFWDDDSGGLFTNGADAAELIVRRKEFYDSPVPSANANAAFSLFRAAAIHGRPDLADRAEVIVRLTAGDMESQPQAHPRMLSAFDLVVGGTSEIVISGDRPDLLKAAQERFLPSSVLLHGEPFESAVWADRSGNRAFVCRNYTCQLPSDDVNAFVAELRSLTGLGS